MSGAIYIHWYTDWNTDHWTIYFSSIVLTATDKMAAVSCLLHIIGTDIKLCSSGGGSVQGIYFHSSTLLVCTAGSFEPCIAI